METTDDNVRTQGMTEHVETSTRDNESQTTILPSAENEKRETTNQTKTVGTHKQGQTKQATALEEQPIQKATKQLQKQWIEQNTIPSESENEDTEQRHKRGKDKKTKNEN